ncbi:MAG TPA: hypothetical protein VFO42_03495 [Sphingomicrobium sp.]|nr:hypothetical protein [Sphingomicrobium sp.]
MWLLLLAIQSWSIQHDRRQFHRTNGLVSFALFPLFLAGGATIFVGMAERFVEAASPFYRLYPPRLAWLDFVAILGMAFFYFQALRYRRFVGKHSSYLLATAVFLLPPMLGRLAPLAMGLNPTQPDFFEKLHGGFHVGNIATAAIAFFIAWRAGRNGKPFTIAGALVLLSSLLFEMPGGLAAWWSLYPHFADLPAAPLALTAGLFGAAVGWAGWRAGSPRREPLAAA